MLATFIKRTGDQLDYDLGFDKFLIDGDAIISATASVLPGDDLEIMAVMHTDSDVKVWVNEGAEKVNYVILVTITTALGRIKEEEFTIRIRN